MSHDVRLAGVLIGVIALVFGAAYGRELPGAPTIAGALATASALLCVLPSRLIAASALALAVTALTLAIHWTLDERVIGGHVVLGACTVVWIAQRALEASWRKTSTTVQCHRRQSPQNDLRPAADDPPRQASLRMDGFSDARRADSGGTRAAPPSSR